MSNRFNGYLSSHFKGHPQVYEFTDANRSRVVRVFDVGDAQVLGVSDGVESWMIPRSGAIDGKLCANMKPTDGVMPREVHPKKIARARLIDDLIDDLHGRDDTVQPRRARLHV